MRVQRARTQATCMNLHGMMHGRAPVAQLDRAPDFESVGRRFESCRARHRRPVAMGTPGWTQGLAIARRERARHLALSTSHFALKSGPVAQLVEQQTLNLLVEGSIPSGLTTPPSESEWFRPEVIRHIATHCRSSRMGTIPSGLTTKTSQNLTSRPASRRVSALLTH